MSIAQRLLELSRQEADWVSEARDALAGDVRSDLAKDLLCSGLPLSPLVAVFGEPQRGKTTLILKLLGVRDDSQASVYTALRAGRPRGRSATATAMVYRKDAGEELSVEWAGRTTRCTDFSSLEDALNEVRGAIEKSPGAQVAEVVVRLPRSLFDAGAQDFQLVDLPGVGSTSVDEQLHLQFVLQHFLPRIGLLLVVEELHHLATLGRKSVPGLRRLADLLPRIRFCFTRGYSADSMKKVLDEQPVVTGDVVRAYVRGEAIRSWSDRRGDAASFSSLSPSALYVFELGDSWQALTAAEKGRIKPAIEAMLTELRADILRTGTVGAMAEALAGVGQPFETLARAAAEDLEERIDECEVKIDKLQNRVQTIEEHTGSRAEAVAEAKAAAKASKTLLRKIQASELSLPRVHRVATNKDAMITALDGRFRTYVQVWNRIQEEWDVLVLKLYPKRAPDAWRRVKLKVASNRGSRDRARARLVKDLNSYWVDEYYPQQSNSYAEDIGRLNDFFGDLEESFIECRAMAGSAMDGIVKSFEKQCAAVEGILAETESVLAARKSEREKLKEEVARQRRLSKEAKGNHAFDQGLLDGARGRLDRSKGGVVTRLLQSTSDTARPVEDRLLRAMLALMVRESEGVKP